MSEILQVVVFFINAPLVAAVAYFLWRLDRRVFRIELKLGIFPERRTT